MKHLLVSTIAFIVYASSVQAQKKETFRSSQSRALEPTQEVFIRPKVATLELMHDGKRIKTEPFKFEEDQYDWRVLTIEQLEQLKATALYMAADIHDADVIIGATFDVRHLEKGKGVEIVVKGYPAKYTGWTDAKDADYIWINNIYGIKNRFESEKENTKAVKR